MPAERDRPRDSSPVRHPDTVPDGDQTGAVTVAAAVVEQAGAGAASTALPGVLADVPVAVLLSDRSAGAVTYANTAAVELAGNVRLPVDIDTWGASVGLTDLGGQPLASSSGPLSLVAQGLPVSGEAVRIAPDRAADRSDQLLWVTGFPLSRPDGDEHLSLVVFLEVEAGAPDAAGNALRALRERAVVATDIAFTITDPREPDDALVWVNPSFTRITGYSYDEVVGRQEAELARATAERAQADAERARADAERIQGRLALMAEATSTLIAMLDLTDVLDRPARLCVPLLSDWVFISLVDDTGTVRETASRHRDGLEDELRALATQHAAHLPEASRTRRSIATSRPVLIQRAEEELDALFTSDAARAAAERLGTGSLLAVPMVARRRTRGAILLARADTERPFDQEDVDLDEGIAVLVDRLVAAPPGAGPRQLCDAAVAGSLDGRDDVALIAIRFC